MKRCLSCGAENPDEARFCFACGQPLDAAADAAAPVPQRSVPGQNAGLQPKAQPTAGKTRSPWRIATLCMAALCILGCVLLLRRCSSSGKDGTNAPRQQGAACKQCEEIAELQQKMMDTLEENKDFTLTYTDYERWRDNVNSIASEILLLSGHKCSAPVTKVENQAFIYGRYVGYYIGAWQGALPTGEGCFAGSWRTHPTEKHTMVYSGEWSGGKPNGEGTLMRYDAGFCEALYVGSMRDGEPHGDCYASIKYSAGDDCYEFFNGTFDKGELSGKANFMLYRNGRLYDCGEVEGPYFNLVYSAREERVKELEAAAYSRIIGFAVARIGEQIKYAYENNGAYDDPRYDPGKPKWAPTERQISGMINELMTETEHWSNMGKMLASQNFDTDYLTLDDLEYFTDFFNEKIDEWSEK